MTHPISNERATWLNNRLIVVERCIKISQTEMYAMNGGGAARQDLQTSLLQFTAERMTIKIELAALKDLDVQP